MARTNRHPRDAEIRALNQAAEMCGERWVLREQSPSAGRQRLAERASVVPLVGSDHDLPRANAALAQSRMVDARLEARAVNVGLDDEGLQDNRQQRGKSRELAQVAADACGARSLPALASASHHTTLFFVDGVIQYRRLKDFAKR